jgi:hypothetical protein
MKRKGIEFAFSWIFAIIAGAVILISAVYITTKLVGTERRTQDSFIASELTNLLNPIETNLENSKYVKIDFVDETRVFNECKNEGVFGRQQISTSSKLGIGDEWGEKSARRSSFNKYLFSDEIVETSGKKMHAIVKPFFSPFKAGDLTILYGEDYCFVNPTSDIEDLIEDLSANGANNIGINVTGDLDDCLQETKTVCFGNQIGCDVNVNTLAGIVVKDQKESYFYGEELQLAAIFADSNIYECQIKRLAGRSGELAVIYAKKAAYVDGSGCSNNLQGDLNSFVLAASINNSREYVRELIPLAIQLKEKNDKIAKCKIF